MNRTKLKNYAPLARRAFIQAVTDRAAFYGLTATKIEPITEQGDVAVIGGRAFPRSVARKRQALEARIVRHGFAQTLEAMAYTWFNRFVAMRFMELHDYLDHGYRVLSHPEGKTTPEILEHAEHVELPGLDKNTVIDLKLDGSKEAELYRLLLIAQCNALHVAMPFLFEQIDDETELLLPDNLLHSDSLIRKLVNEIDEEDWREVEIIGWLYQFYISEKKDQVIGKVVKSEDIPAATQLFTPNWIVKYLVQNSLGRQWLTTYPTSTLRQQMEYYIEPAEQTPEVQAQLKAITPESLNPEELTLLDPACGSGHILVEAYDLFKAIYQERGYRARDIPTLILQKNLFGLEIDDRAAQLAAFALLMKARSDDRRIFTSGVQPQVLSIQESKGLNAKALTEALNVPLAQGERVSEKPEEPVIASPSTALRINSAKQSLSEKEIASSLAAPRNDRSLPISSADIADLINLFEHGKTFGSLIQVPPTLAEKLPIIGHRVKDVLAHGDLMTQPAAKVLLPLVEQAWVLSRQYDAVVANPPYMGNKGLNAALKSFAQHTYPEGKSDLFSMFILRAFDLVLHNGHLGLMTPFVWMFLQTYKKLRERILNDYYLCSLIQPEYHAFFDSAFVPICTFLIAKTSWSGESTFINLTNFYGYDLQPQKTLEAIRDVSCRWRYDVNPADFRAIPNTPIAYGLRGIWNFKHGKVGERAVSGGRCKTHNDDKYVRYHWEIDREATKWKLYLKGGDFRKFYGNELHVVDWSTSARSQYESHGGLSDSVFWGKEGLTWSLITSSLSSFRIKQKHCEYSSGSPTIFDDIFTCDLSLLGFLNSKVASYYLKAFNPTLNTTVNDVFSLPLVKLNSNHEKDLVQCAPECIKISKQDWDSYERSWDFQTLPVLRQRAATLAQSQAAADAEVLARFQRMKQLEEENNRLFIEAYGLQDELSPEVPDDQITLARPDREEDIKRLISYAIGCMMGRYSLDKPGLVYASSGNQGFDLSQSASERSDDSVIASAAKQSFPEKEIASSLMAPRNDIRPTFQTPSQYTTFPPDPDGIVPIMDTDWFPDDAANRFVEFISVVWPKEHLEENLTFVAESLGPNRGEEPRDTIRRYLAQSFFKDHLKTYKRRPIYWLFTSGKQRAFQCLVYLHRYHEGTLSRMRTEYVIPLQGKINARIEQLASEIQRASSTAHRKKLEKEQDALRKQQTELQAFDEKLRYYADMRISLDLDDGVKVNYGKFGDVLAEVKAVCGEENH